MAGSEGRSWVHLALGCKLLDQARAGSEEDAVQACTAIRDEVLDSLLLPDLETLLRVLALGHPHPFAHQVSLHSFADGR